MKTNCYKGGIHLLEGLKRKIFLKIWKVGIKKHYESMGTEGWEKR